MVHVIKVNSGTYFCRNCSKWVVSFIFLQRLNTALQWEGRGGLEGLEPPLPSSYPSDTWLYKYVKTVVKEMDFASQQYLHWSVAR